jgi:hypothetical protein
MSEVTGRLLYDGGDRVSGRPWLILGISYIPPHWRDATTWRSFRRRIDAVAFAARKGIRLVTE